MVKLIMLLVSKTTKEMIIYPNDPRVQETSSPYFVNRYPLVDVEELLPIICDDIETIYKEKKNSFIKMYKGSEEYRNIEAQLRSVDVKTTTETSEVIKVVIPNTTYYLRRHVMETSESKVERLRKFHLKINLSDLESSLREIPFYYEFLTKEANELMERLSKYLPIKDYVSITLQGDIEYTKQYITEFLIQSEHPSAEDYLTGFFNKQDELVYTNGLYKPFTDRIAEAMDETKENSTPMICKEVFNRKHIPKAHSSHLNTIFLYSNEKMIIPALKEEVDCLNKDYEVFSRLPNKFLLEGRIVVKEGSEPHKLIIPATQIDQDFLSLGEATIKAKITTEGFLLESNNLFNVDLKYIVDNLSTEYKTVPVTHALTNLDKVHRTFMRLMPNNERGEDTSKIISAILNPSLEREIYDRLVISLRIKGASRNLIEMLDSKLFGVN